MQKRADNYNCDTKDLKELLTKMLKVRHEKTAKFVALKKSDKDRKKKERMRIKLMATSDPELKASLRRKKSEEMKRYRQRKS